MIGAGVMGAGVMGEAVINAALARVEGAVVALAIRMLADDGRACSTPRTYKPAPATSVSASNPTRLRLKRLRFIENLRVLGEYVEREPRPSNELITLIL